MMSDFSDLLKNDSELLVKSSSKIFDERDMIPQKYKIFYVYNDIIPI